QATFAETFVKRMGALRKLIEKRGVPITRLRLEPEIKGVMLELLANNFFGAKIPYKDIRERFVPCLEISIDHMVRGQVTNPLWLVPNSLMRGPKERKAFKAYDALADLCLAWRATDTGLWKRFAGDFTDEQLRPNIKAFLAGALEATTSYASSAISHLARNTRVQEKLFSELKDINDFTPEAINKAEYLSKVLNETLRLTPSLYFLPRKPKIDPWEETSDEKRMLIPAGTHVFLDVWHANRHEDHWGVEATGYPALDFVPERWDADNMAKHH